MRNRLRLALGRLASTEYQQRLIVHGTVDRYELPGEVLDSAYEAVRLALASPSFLARGPDGAAGLLKDFLDLVDATVIPLNDDSVSGRELVENDPGWSAVRAGAGKLAFALDLAVDLDELLES